jgi:hypothetical protein
MGLVGLEGEAVEVVEIGAREEQIDSLPTKTLPR